MVLENNSTLLMIGDSITDCGRAYPVGEARHEGGLGQGYVSMIAEMSAIGPGSRQTRFLNMGVSGNTVRDLRNRWQSDVIDLAPDYLSIMIGINDVWREIESPGLSGAGVPLEEFETTLNDLIAQTVDIVRGLILMTPYVIEPDRDDPMRALMDQYGAAVKRLADKYNSAFVDTQAAFDELISEQPPISVAADRIHPIRLGQMAIATAFMGAVST